MFEEEENLRAILFWFSPLLAQRDRFMDTILKAWSIHVLGSPIYVWEQKLKATKTTLKEWIKKSTDSPTSHRKQNIQQLHDFQMGLELQGITCSEIQIEQEHQISNFRSFREEEESLRLKSHNLWLVSRDKNSAFFHKQI